LGPGEKTKGKGRRKGVGKKEEGGKAGGWRQIGEWAYYPKKTAPWANYQLGGQGGPPIGAWWDNWAGGGPNTPCGLFCFPLKVWGHGGNVKGGEGKRGKTGGGGGGGGGEHKRFLFRFCVLNSLFFD